MEKVVKDLVKVSAFHPAEAAFMAKYALASRRAAKRRRQAAEGGGHVPPFLIASITSQCNLHCAGCYARDLDFCGDGPARDQMSAQEWAGLFRQARDLGVGFILLAGGEPLVRWDVIQAAAGVPEILFPVFTNGTMLGTGALDYLAGHRNLLPVLSVEGGREATDARRGEGVYDRVEAAVAGMAQRRINMDPGAGVVDHAHKGDGQAGEHVEGDITFFHTASGYSLCEISYICPEFKTAADGIVLRITD